MKIVYSFAKKYETDKQEEFILPSEKVEENENKFWIKFTFRKF